MLTQGVDLTVPNWENMSNEGQGGATVNSHYKAGQVLRMLNRKNIGHFSGKLRHVAAMLLSSVLILLAIF